MKNTSFYFDYICPFCYRSFNELTEYKKSHPDLTIHFHPFEIHPRPENFGKHSDLCIRGMFLAKELGVDLWAYNRTIFNARFQQRADIENIDVLSDILKDLIDPEVFRNAISCNLVNLLKSFSFTDAVLSSHDASLNIDAVLSG